ncbi:MAG: histidine phosphatase family protein [Rickettsiales bacterium]
MKSKTLCLLRHAHSVKGDAITPDHERELSTGGIEECNSIAKWMKKINFSVDAVICSDAMRTRQTYGAVNAAHPLPTADYQAGLYLAASGGILKAIKNTNSKHDSLLVIGHNPGLHDIALKLLCDEDRRDSMLVTGLVTAGLVVLEAPAASWDALAYGQCRFKHYIQP